MSKLADKVALVTGASKGIGAAIAKALAAEGAAVVINYASSKAGADAVVAAIAAEGGRAVAVHGDVAKEADAKALVDAAIEHFGRLDIVVNNSGIYGFSPIEEVTVEQYRSMFDINVLGTLLVTKAAVPHLNEGASVINISSNITSVQMAGAAVYAGTKGAVDVITGVLANELGPRGIRVNAILPGATQTEGVETMTGGDSSMFDAFIAQTPLRRAGRPDDIGDVAAFLASDDARWITGERIGVSGGLR